MEKKLHSLKNLGKARKKKRLTQEQLAEIVEKDLKTIRNWEQSLSVPEFDTIVKLADLLECDIDYLSGRLSEPTHDLQFIHDQTGLPTEAIETIMDFNPSRKAALADLLNQELFWILLDDFSLFNEMLKRFDDYNQVGEVTDLSEMELDGNSKLQMPLWQAMMLLSSHVGNDMTEICMARRDAKRIELWNREPKDNKRRNAQRTKSPDPATATPDQESQRSTQADDHSIMSEEGEEGSNA